MDGSVGGAAVKPPANANSSTPTSQSRAMTRPLLLLVILCILLLAGCGVLLATLIYLVTQKPRGDLCLSEDCVVTAATVLKSIDESIDPCDDFYKYACGQWEREHAIPDSQPSVSNFDSLNKNLESSLNVLLDAAPSETDGTAVIKTKQFYQLCLNETEINGNWRQTFDDILVNDFDGWPSLTRDWNQTKSLEELYARMTTRYQADWFFKINVQPDDKNSSVHVLLLDSPALNLFSREFYLFEDAKDERNAYEQLIVEILGMLGVDNATASRDAADILAFETELANASIPDKKRHDMQTLYNKITLGDLSQRYTKFNWIRFLHHMYENVDGDKDYTELFDQNHEVVVYGIDFLERFDEILDQSRADHRTIVNYLCWCWFYKGMLKDLPDPFAVTLFKFYKKLEIMSVQTLRWHGCVKRINSLMPLATGRMYVKEHFNENAKNKVEEMIGRIMQELRHILAEEEWLSESTKKVANEKITAMEQKIGFPDMLNDREKVDKAYEKYAVTIDNYFITKFNFYEQERKETLAKVAKKVDRSRWVSGAAVVNAFYSPNTNEIIFPAGILQPVFYDEKFPWSMNFGGIGVVIGHEIIHGFDDRGRLYDKLGNIRQWWDNKTIESFKEKAKCIEDQYSSYIYEQVNMTIDGKKTKGENIADNGGLRLAFKAYQKWAKDRPDTQLLPGIDMTHEQLFFVNYAQIWCGHMNDKEAVRKIRTSEHCPGSVRVKGPLSNSNEFASAFNCPVNSRMNPPKEKKCRVW